MMGDMMARFPKLEFVSSFGVGYDNIDIKYAVEHGITVTNTPEVLNEEVADTALGLLLCTVREFPQASNFLRAGKWMERQYPLTKRPCATAPSAWSAWAHRPGDRAAARRLRRTGGVSQPRSAGGRDLQALSQADRHGARRRHAHSHHAGRSFDQASRQCRSARRVGSQRDRHQHVARTVVDDAALIKALKERKIYAAGLECS